jgi:hypothetical protein
MPEDAAAIAAIYNEGIADRIAMEQIAKQLLDKGDRFPTMLASAALAAVIGFSAALPYAGAAALVLLYAVLIWSDSSSLTAGSAGSAEPGQRGATLAVHSTLGYAGGFIGPLALDGTLDLLGGASVIGWGVAFGHVTVALLLGALVFVWLRPAHLAEDRPVSAATAVAAPLHRT